jgi:hypothetical protein
MNKDKFAKELLPSLIIQLNKISMNILSPFIFLYIIVKSVFFSFFLTIFDKKGCLKQICFFNQTVLTLITGLKFFIINELYQVTKFGGL